MGNVEARVRNIGEAIYLDKTSSCRHSIQSLRHCLAFFAQYLENLLSTIYLLIRYKNDIVGNILLEYLGNSFSNCQYSIWWKERGTCRRYEGTLKNDRKVNGWMKIKDWKCLVFDNENRLCLWANVGWLQQPRAVQAIIGIGKVRFFILENLAFSKKKNK